jgi:hypothetical protein
VNDLQTLLDDCDWCVDGGCHDCKRVRSAFAAGFETVAKVFDEYTISARAYDLDATKHEQMAAYIRALAPDAQPRGEGARCERCHGRGVIITGGPESYDPDGRRGSGTPMSFAPCPACQPAPPADGAPGCDHRNQIGVRNEDGFVERCLDCGAVVRAGGSGRDP